MQHVRKTFGTIIIVKENPRKSWTQGSVQYGDKPFKDAMHEWNEENPESS
jgi:hypothetical protein